MVPKKIVIMLRNKDLAVSIFIALIFFLYKIVKKEKKEKKKVNLFCLALFVIIAVIMSAIAVHIDHWNLWAGIASGI